MAKKFLRATMPWGLLSVTYDKGVIYGASLAAEVHADTELGSWPELEEKLKRYAAGQAVSFTEPLALDSYPPFYKKVWLYVQKTCSWGTVMTYQQIAQAIGNPKAARAVGNAMRCNPIALFIP